MIIRSLKNTLQSSNKRSVWINLLLTGFSLSSLMIGTGLFVEPVRAEPIWGDPYSPIEDAGDLSPSVLESHRLDPHEARLTTEDTRRWVGCPLNRGLLPYEVFLGLNPSQWGFFQELRMDIYILDVEMLQAHTQEEKDMLIQELADILPRLRERGATPEVMAAALLSFFTYRDDFQTEAAWREWVDRFSDPQRPLMQHSSIILQLSLMSLQAIEADSIPFGKGIANRDIVPGRVGGNLLPEEELRIPRRDLIFVDPLQESADVSVLRGIVAGNPDAYPELAAFYGL